VVTLSCALQRGEYILALGGGGVGSTVELGLHQASNREQLGLLVEGEGLLPVEVNGQGRDAKNWNVSLDASAIVGRTYWDGQP